MAPTTIRPLEAGDALHAARIFFEAVHKGTKDHYTPDQRRAWAGESIDHDAWRLRLAGQIGFVAEQNGTAVGFMTIDATGYIDFAFVQPSAAGSGVGKMIYRAVEQKARELGAPFLTTNASKAAKPFFERLGWSVIAEQTVERQGVQLINYRMKSCL